MLFLSCWRYGCHRLLACPFFLSRVAASGVFFFVSWSKPVSRVLAKIFLSRIALCFDRVPGGVFPLVEHIYSSLYPTLPVGVAGIFTSDSANPGDRRRFTRTPFFSLVKHAFHFFGGYYELNLSPADDAGWGDGVKFPWLWPYALWHI